MRTAGLRSAAPAVALNSTVSADIAEPVAAPVATVKRTRKRKAAPAADSAE